MATTITGSHSSSVTLSTTAQNPATVATGATISQIAQTLHLAEGTIRNRISTAMTKLHARDRAQLVVLAYESGLVAPRKF